MHTIFVLFIFAKLLTGTKILSVHGILNHITQVTCAFDSVGYTKSAAKILWVYHRYNIYFAYIIVD